ncbi:MAG: hypothetical protein GC178_14735 [Flavobacteriales bacterium]|nr:hypothetical protein [Flavobacteriales bacterium]
MKSSKNNTKELVLEVAKDGFRRLVYRTWNNDGSVLFLEESDLEDFSRPICENNDFNVFFSERDLWKSFTDYTSSEGVLNRSVWHETADEWLQLKPLFIHQDMKLLIQNSLADATREIQINDTRKIDGIRMWLRALSKPTQKLEKAVTNPLETYRHAV